MPSKKTHLLVLRVDDAQALLGSQLLVLREWMTHTPSKKTHLLVLRKNHVQALQKHSLPCSEKESRTGPPKTHLLVLRKDDIQALDARRSHHRRLRVLQAALLGPPGGAVLAAPLREKGKAGGDPYAGRRKGCRVAKHKLARFQY